MPLCPRCESEAEVVSRGRGTSLLGKLVYRLFVRGRAQPETTVWCDKCSRCSIAQ